MYLGREDDVVGHELAPSVSEESQHGEAEHYVPLQFRGEGVIDDSHIRVG